MGKVVFNHTPLVHYKQVITGGRVSIRYVNFEKQVHNRPLEKVPDFPQEMHTRLL